MRAIKSSPNDPNCKLVNNYRIDLWCMIVQSRVLITIELTYDVWLYKVGIIKEFDN